MAGSRTLMGWIVHSSLRFRFLVAGLAAAMLVVGAVELQRMRVDVFPEFAPTRVVVETGCVGLSAADVESLVTVPLEQALNGVAGLTTMRSRSVQQLSSIEMIFGAGSDMVKARQLVQERLSNIQGNLPAWAGVPSMHPPVSATSRLMQIGMSSKTLSTPEMSMMAYSTIRSRILRVPGVANVAIWGEQLVMETVQVEPQKLKANNVTLQSVMEATAASVDTGLLKFSNGSVVGTGGNVETPAQRLGIRNVDPIVTSTDLARVSARAHDGTPVPIGAVATVQEDHQPLIGDAVVGGGPGLLLVVEKLPWGDTRQITQDVEDAIAALQPGFPGVTFDTRIFQQKDFIDTAIRNLTQSMLLGFLLVVLILIFFLFEWRVAVISLLAIPLSLMAAMLVLYWRGDTVNTMTLAGLVIALGAVVDDAIIDLENILRRLRQHRVAGSGESTESIILRACLEVRSPIVFATLIIVAAAVPVFLLQGLTGAFFQPLAVSYTVAIVASMVVALTVTPALALILLRDAKVERHGSPLTRWLQARYSAVLSRITIRPYRAYALFGIIAVTSVAALPFLGQSLFPTFKERDLLMHWTTTPGTSVIEEQRIVTSVSRELSAIPGVLSFASHIGQAFKGEEVVGVNFGENWLRLDPNADYDKTLAAIRAVVANYPGLYRDVETYLNERIDEVLTGAKQPIVVRIFGQDLASLKTKANEIQRKLSTIPGITDDFVDLQADTPQVTVEVDLAKAARYSLKPGDVRRAAATLVAGEEVGDIFRNGKNYRVVVWSTPPTRASVQSISDLLIDTPAGTPVHLGDVAKVVIKPVPNVIQRDNGSRRIDVTANVSGRDLGSVTQDVSAALANVTFDRGYHAELIGEYTERQDAQSRLLGTAIIAAVAILLLLQVAFGSWRLAALIFLTLPMALVGGVLAAYLGGGVLSLGSLLGFFTVFAIAARNGILLINHCQHLERAEGEPFGPALVLRGARERLAPILMTSLATGLAVVPLVVFGSRPGYEIEYPLAVVILGGLVTSTLLNLFVVPSLYLRFGKRRRKHSASA